MHEFFKQSRTSEYILALIDTFTHKGPNSSHMCIVSKLLGPSVETIVKIYRLIGDRLSTEDIIRLAKHILRAIAEIHEAGFAHGGKQIVPQ
jgi:serine/threonine protein kinase